MLSILRSHAKRYEEYKDLWTILFLFLYHVLYICIDVHYACSVNDDGITPVHQAASEGHVQCLKLLIEAGAKIDGRDCRGNTPLDLAKLWAHRKCARYVGVKFTIQSCLALGFGVNPSPSTLGNPQPHTKAKGRLLEDQCRVLCINSCKKYNHSQCSGAVWKSRWTSWAPVPNKPMVSVDVKQHFN